jgi:hypothetical protein
MAGHAGFDRSTFPGIAKMASMKSTTNLEWCGFYLAPAPSHSNTSWMPQRAAIVGQGWGIAPLYVGQQTIGPGSHVVTKAQGVKDGNNAVQLMQTAGFPSGTWIYLDLENGPPFPPNQQNYVDAWVKTVDASNVCRGGVYCSHLLANAVQALCPSARLWVFKVPTTSPHPVPPPPFPTPNPSGSGFPAAHIWQREQNARIQVLGSPLIVDLNSALNADPGI